MDTLGGLWLERHLSAFIGHILDLAASPRVSTGHGGACMDADTILSLRVSADGADTVVRL